MIRKLGGLVVFFVVFCGLAFGMVSCNNNNHARYGCGMLNDLGYFKYEFYQGDCFKVVGNIKANI